MRAIILAAGRGSRLGKYTDNRPKCLVEVGGKTLIEQSLKNLKEAGFDEVVVVVGYLHDKLEEEIAKHSDPKFCRTIFNSDYTRGSGSSLICAADEFSGEVLLLESDLLYDTSVVARIKDFQGNAFALGNFNHDRKEIKVVLEDGYVKKAAWGGPETECDGDWVGFTRLSKEAALELQSILKTTDPNQGKEINYEDFIFQLLQKHKFATVAIQDLPWIEVDNEEDLIKAENHVIPRIRK